MTDRDRLAVDLREVLWAVPVDVEDVAPIWTGYADRLIALGWTRLDESGRVLGHPIEDVIRWKAEYDMRHVPAIAFGWTRLDEERLARALASIEGDFVGKGSMWTVRAAQIAKAYREDTE